MCIGPVKKNNENNNNNNNNTDTQNRPPYLALWRERAGERLDRLVGAALLDERDRRVEQQQRADERKVGVVEQDDGEHKRDLHRPGERVPEVAEEAHKGVDRHLGQLVRPKLGDALLRLSLGQALVRRLLVWYCVCLLFWLFGCVSRLS